MDDMNATEGRRVALVANTSLYIGPPLAESWRNEATTWSSATLSRVWSKSSKVSAPRSQPPKASGTWPNPRSLSGS